MSRDYGKVRAQFWDDDALRELSIEANYLALYLITSRHTNAVGCFRLPAAYILNDTRLDKKTLDRALAELSSVGYAIACEKAPWIYIPNFLRHNPPENPNVWRKCVKELSEIPAAVSAGGQIASDLLGIADEDRMSRDGSKNRVSDEEKSRVQQYRNGFDTVEDGLTPIPLPSPNHVQANLSPAEAGPKSYSDQFEEFWKAYPTDKNMSKKAAFKQWQRLSADKRQQAIDAIPGFKRYCSANHDWYRPVYAERFLSQEKFEGYLAEKRPANDSPFNSPEEIEAQRRIREAAYGQAAN